MESIRLAKKALTNPRAIPSAIRKRAVPPDPRGRFHDDLYLRINGRRLEHLASLGLPLDNRTVLEVGAGIGDLTSFFVDRGCTIVTSEGRPGNLAVLRSRYPDIDARLLDLEKPDEAFDVRAEIVFCYGLLYHLEKPDEALAFLGARTLSLLLLETIVSPAGEVDVEQVQEKKHVPSEAVSGIGSRPTRSWVCNELGRHFPHVYCTRTQPWHPEFPLDWTTSAPAPRTATRAVFVAAREAIDNPWLTDQIPDHHVHH
jgi:hypothetical protein